MYGLIGRFVAAPGQRDALISILLAGGGAMPGCLSYVVARDPVDKARPLIAGFREHIETAPIGGHGLPAPPT